MRKIRTFTNIPNTVEKMENMKMNINVSKTGTDLKTFLKVLVRIAQALCI